MKQSAAGRHIAHIAFSHGSSAALEAFRRSEKTDLREGMGEGDAMRGTDGYRASVAVRAIYCTVWQNNNRALDTEE